MLSLILGFNLLKFPLLAVSSGLKKIELITFIFSLSKIFILTGEPSGDKLASTVISKLKIDNPDILFSVDSPDFTLRVAEKVKKIK